MATFAFTKPNSTKMSPLPSYSPGVLSLLPLYYVGWADSLLSPAEVKLIRNKISKLSFLEADDKKLLLKWADPAHPPQHQLFRQWGAILRRAAAELPRTQKQSLVELGLEMARKSTEGGQLLHWKAPQTKEALEELEEALGILSGESYRGIFGTPSEEDAKEAFSSQAMQALLDDDYGPARQRMRTLLSDPAFQYQTLPQKEDQRDLVLKWCHLLAERGLGAISYPEAYGGKDDMGEYAAVFEMLGYHDLSLTIKFGVQFGLFGGSVLWLGTDYHHGKYLHDIGRLELPGCFAMTETGHGSNVRGLETTATYQPETDTIIVHSPNEAAGKEYIGNALHGRMATVFAQLLVDGKNHGVHAVLVPLRDEQHQLMPGIRVEDCGYKLGLNGVDNGRIWFDQVEVPRKNLLNRFGDITPAGQYQSPIENPDRRFFTMLGTLVGGRVCVPRAGLSAAKSGLTIAIRYALQRRQFAPDKDQPESLLLDYPTHQRRLMPHLAKAYALDFALTYLTKRYVQRSEADIREIETLAAGLKSYATWFTTACLQECREACGGKGYLAENRFAALKADTDIFTTFEGDNTVLMQLVAKGLLSDFRQEFHDDGFRAVMRLLSRQITTSLTERNLFIKRKTDHAHLTDDEFHRSAFRYRRHTLLVSVAQRMQRLIRRGMHPYDAFLRCQTHLLHLAHAYVEELVLEQFLEKVTHCEDASLRKPLEKLYQLFALSTIEEHKGWYLENNYLEGVKTKAIRRTVDKLCREIREQASLLVDAFGIPDSCLAAPIVVQPRVPVS